MSLKRDLMKRGFFYFLWLLVLFGFPAVASGQETRQGHLPGTAGDTLSQVQQSPRYIKGVPVQGPAQEGKINLDAESSLRFVKKMYSSESIWKKSSDPLRDALGILIYHASRPPVDSTVSYLLGYDYSALRIPLENFYVLDSVRIIVPALVADSVAGDTVAVPGAAVAGEMFVKTGKSLEKIKLTSDARPVSRTDTVPLNDSVYIMMDDLAPSALPKVTTDTIILVVTDTLPEPALHTPGFPFRYLRYPYMSDSLAVAVKTLSDYIARRDSTHLSVVSETGRVTEMWLNGNSDNLVRFWLPDGETDSVTVWIGNPQRNTLTLKAEEGVLFKKQMWHDKYVDTRVDVTTSKEEELRKVQLTNIKPNYWKYKGNVSYLLSQGVVSNWAKGGENNISSVLDITGSLDYNNKATKVSSSTWGRFALGLQASGKNTGIRKNLDVLEIYSKLNHKAFGKFDFSGTFQFKSQFLPGYNYPNDSVKVSKFFNPAIMIFGYGLDYKPNKNTSINFSPLSYKGTFVPDTADINQTKYGVPADRRSKNEMGAYLTIISKNRLFDKVEMTNRLQMFSNFIDKPQNVDVDWEMIATINLNWFTDLRINTHMIYDDNTRLPVYDSEGNPVLGPDGLQKKSPRLQFKELLGVSFNFRF